MKGVFCDKPTDINPKLASLFYTMDRYASFKTREWGKKYLEGGEEALVNKRKPGNPLAKYERRKELTPTEQLEYRIALLERELLKKNGEIERLKKSIELEGGDAKRK